MGEISRVLGHILQVMFLKDFFSKLPAAKSNILRHDWRKF